MGWILLLEHLPIGVEFFGDFRRCLRQILCYYNLEEKFEELRE
jgi:hypothetical protein